MTTIQLKNVEKLFGAEHAVKPMNLTIEDGEFVVLLGPSGCGKTTTLRMISGLEAVTGGNILFGDRDVTWLHPSERDIAFVFQFFALYSHMTCRDNIAFPLQAQGVPRQQIETSVRQVAELLKIGHILKLRPGGLSGGDQQRVALARALVRQPEAFLMDEPLGALDAEFRETMRAEIKQLHIDQNATTVYVTHDQIEAMAMGDKIVVMSAAEIQQVGSPLDVYHNPSNLFVAQFIGSPGMNLIQGAYDGGKVHLGGNTHLTVPDNWKPVIEKQIGSGGKVTVGFRPEAANLTDTGEIPAKVFGTDLYGGYTMVVLELETGDVVEIRAPRSEHRDMGETITFNIDPEMIRFFDPQSEEALKKDGAA
jgi:multiple sugar transport system ATP-binding protein